MCHFTNTTCFLFLEQAETSFVCLFVMQWWHCYCCASFSYWFQK